MYIKHVLAPVTGFVLRKKFGKPKQAGLTQWEVHFSVSEIHNLGQCSWVGKTLLGLMRRIESAGSDTTTPTQGRRRQTSDMGSLRNSNTWKTPRSTSHEY